MGQAGARNLGIPSKSPTRVLEPSSAVIPGELPGRWTGLRTARTQIVMSCCFIGLPFNTHTIAGAPATTMDYEGTDSQTVLQPWDQQSRYAAGTAFPGSELHNRTRRLGFGQVTAALGFSSHQNGCNMSLTHRSGLTASAFTESWCKGKCMNHNTQELISVQPSTLQVSKTPGEAHASTLAHCSRERFSSECCGHLGRDGSWQQERPPWGGLQEGSPTSVPAQPCTHM